jgi:iron complex transport system ATP-binding protein
MTDLRVEKLSVEIEGKRLLDDVSFRVQTGEVVGLIGPNGAGKSTALRAILGLIEACDGHVRLGSDDMNFIPAQERARRIAYMPQGAPVHWPLTGERTVALGRIPHLSPWQELSAEDEAAIEDAMVRTDCAQFRERLVTTLSGGERSRVLLARTLAVGARYLLADEPTASHDPLHQLQVMNILRAEASSGAVLLVVMHDLTQAARYCDKLVLLDEGRLVAKGTPAEVLTDENIRAAFGVKVARWQDGDHEFIIPDTVIE